MTDNAAEGRNVPHAARQTPAHYTRYSSLYRWVTTEPDPDVVVIDLRDTYTVGPFIALLDRSTPVLERLWCGSLAYRAAERLGTAARWAGIRESRTVQLLAAALEPPAPPEERRE